MLQLITNYGTDFQKQDGVTEIEESIMANTVERRLNDLLLRDEASGKLKINRLPIYVSAVSNFTNFLDLSRKGLRMLECGIPVVVLGRTQVAQHSYRWCKLLVELCKEEGIDPSMITFASCELSDIKDITRSCHVGNLYATCSRQLAAEIKAQYPKTVASTGGACVSCLVKASNLTTIAGPNTMVSTSWDPKLRDAIACSASIESAGQCTALRHTVVPSTVSDDECMHIFDSVVHADSAETALKDGAFACVFQGHTATREPESSAFEKHKSADAFVTIRDGSLPPDGINEYWRKVVTDFTRLDLVKSVGNRSVPIDESISKVSDWLNKNQPISLAVNGLRQEAISIGLKLWEQTGMVVNTVGSIDDPEMPPALTCQARPQEGEVFGEFPPRSSLLNYTLFPVIIPSSNPSYDAHYSPEYLRGRSCQVNYSFSKSTKDLLSHVSDELTLGFCHEIIDYIRIATRQGPRQGYGKERSSLWGLQRPPIQTKTILRGMNWNFVAPAFVLFYITNAREQVQLSVFDDDDVTKMLCDEYNLPHVVESDEAFRERSADAKDIFQVVKLDQGMVEFPMVGNYVSLFFPMGHIKSTKATDEEFILRAKLSQKWLQSLF